MAQLIAHALTLVPPDSYQAGRLLPRYGSVLALEEGEQQGAQEAFSRALAIAHQIQDDELELRTLAEAALVDRYQRRFQESLKKSLRAIELARGVDDLPSELTVRYEAALALEVLGDPEAARQHATEMLALAERLRDRSWVGAALYQLTSLSSDAGGILEDRDSDEAFFNRLREGLPKNIKIIEHANNAEDPEFVKECVDRLIGLIEDKYLKLDDW